jgi:hypothetical protein
MLRIVAPVGISTEVSISATRLIRWAVSIPNVVAVATINIRVPNEIIIVVDIDVVSAPPTSPAPTAAPGRSNSESDSK